MVGLAGDVRTSRFRGEATASEQNVAELLTITFFLHHLLLEGAKGGTLLRKDPRISSRFCLGKKIGRKFLINFDNFKN